MPAFRYEAVDTDWKEIGQTVSADLPGGHVTLYRPGEFSISNSFISQIAGVSSVATEGLLKSSGNHRGSPYSSRFRGKQAIHAPGLLFKFDMPS